MTKVFIDGSAGTTGLNIRERLIGRADVELIVLPEEQRKDISARQDALNSCDVAFLCLPDDAAREAVSLIENPAVAVIDASTAHRTAEGWVYGFPELSGQREKIRASKRIANPGCYASGFIALIRPLTEGGFLSPEASVKCHALSGYTGGGAKTITQYEDAGRDRELKSPRHYGLTLSHKHVPEMMKLTGLTKKPLFAPIICDFPRGMAVSVMFELSELGGVGSPEALRALYKDYYSGAQLVKVMEEKSDIGGFLGSNNLSERDIMELHVFGNEEQVMLVSRLDNLGKGASGAAVQNMNILIGADETAGLDL